MSPRIAASCRGAVRLAALTSNPSSISSPAAASAPRSAARTSWSGLCAIARSATVGSSSSTSADLIAVAAHARGQEPVQRIESRARAGAGEQLDRLRVTLERRLLLRRAGRVARMPRCPGPPDRRRGAAAVPRARRSRGGRRRSADPRASGPGSRAPIRAAGATDRRRRGRARTRTAARARRRRGPTAGCTSVWASFGSAPASSSTRASGSHSGCGGGLPSPLAEYPGEGGERRAQPLPQVARVRIGTVTRGAAARRPVRRRAAGRRAASRSGTAAAPSGAARPRGRRGRGRRRAARAAAPEIARPRLRHGSRFAASPGSASSSSRARRHRSGSSAAVVQAGEAQEPGPPGARPSLAAAPGSSVWRAGVASGEREVGLEPLPALESRTGARPRARRRCAVNASSSGEPGGRVGETGMELAYDLRSAGVAGTDGFTQRQGAAVQLLEVGIAGKTADGHGRAGRS